MAPNSSPPPMPVRIDLLFEAAVAGGIPFIRPLRESLLGEPVRRVMGIMNGTTNYILTRMTEAGADYGEALAEAQALGYAEADPTADVGGFDAAAEIAIVASIAFGAEVTASMVDVEGITSVTADDIAFASRNGFVIKLLAVAERSGLDAAALLSAAVHPVLVPAHHPLASVRESFNAVFVEGDAVGELMFYGRGAGGDPTASAGARGSHRRRGQSASLELTHPSEHSRSRSSARPRMPAPPTTSASWRSIAPGCSPPSPACSVTTPSPSRRCRSRPRIPISVARWTTMKHASTSSPIAPDAAISKPPSPCSAPSTRCDGSAASSGCSARRRTTDDSSDLCEHPRAGAGAGLRGGAARRPRPRSEVSTSPSTGRLFPSVRSNGSPRCPMPTWPSRSCGPSSKAPLIETHSLRSWLTPDATFDTDEVVPLTDLGDGIWLAELFHGPTLAFKDIALQLVGRLFDHELSRRGEKVTVVGATSGTRDRPPSRRCGIVPLQRCSSSIPPVGSLMSSDVR